MIDKIEKVVKYTPVFGENQTAYYEKDENGERKYRVIANQGSTRSSKTYSICQLLITICLTEKKRITIVSQSLPHLKRGARRDFMNILTDMDLYEDSNFNATDQIYYFPETGSYVEFFGVDDIQKVMGPGRDILYCNEANHIRKSVYTQLSLRTNETIFLDFNPASEYSWVYDEADRTGNKLIISNYLNNRSNLTQYQIDEIERLQEADENAWRVYGLGLRGHSTETIYTHWKTCKELPGKGEIVYGVDFGYSNPTAVVRVEIYENAVYAQQMLYQTKLTTSDRIERFKELGIGTMDELFCDSAEPDTIEELARAGFNVKPAKKDVLEGIMKVKSMPLYITEDSIDMLKEIRNYRWKSDIDGKVLDEPVKMEDHCIDSLRYSVYTKLTQPEGTIWTI